MGGKGEHKNLPRRRESGDDDLYDDDGDVNGDDGDVDDDVDDDDEHG